MKFELTTFDIAFPIGLGLLFGVMRYVRLQQAGAPNALNLAAIDALKGILGAGVIMLAYKMLGIL
ncbi:MAG: hypothetical protein LCH46_04715 [Proteobacteria bacterium]|nr:hypothetical protein [Pseudomonadota bacterium]